MEIIGIFGGTFNPIHNGHLVLAQTVLDTLQCSQIRFVPAAVPPHKETPAVTAQHRAAMVQLAIEDQPAFVLDTCELARTGPSYTIETLRLLRQKFPGQSLCLIMGQDSYQKLPSWHRWLALLDHCHLLVVHRAAHDPQLLLHAEHAGRLIEISRAKHVFAEQASGLISFLPITPPAISSTSLRARLNPPQAFAAEAIPPRVLSYITQHHLYQG